MMMHHPIEAIYEDGVLRPLGILALRQHQRVVLQIDEVPPAEETLEDTGFLEYCRAEGGANITLEEVRQSLAVIPGSMTEACSAERDED